MTKVISVINLKGGVGKTSTTVQLAECLALEHGKRVLVVDLDPQTNATISLIEEEAWEELDKNSQTLFHLFNDKLNGTNTFKMQDAIRCNVSNLSIANLHLVPSSIKFIDIQDRLSAVPEYTHYMENPMEVLKNSIMDFLPNYEFVLIDCPPNLGFITKNGIEISDYYLIPTIPDTLSTYGIPQIIKTIDKYSKARHLKIKCLGLVMTRFRSISDSHKRGKASLPARFKKMFDELSLPPAPVFNTIIPEANRLSEAVDIENQHPRTFKQKYGTTKSGDQYIYEYIIQLTEEFLTYVR
jgi:chromosome partitioning protein